MMSRAETLHSQSPLFYLLFFFKGDVEPRTSKNHGDFLLGCSWDFSVSGYTLELSDIQFTWDPFNSSGYKGDIKPITAITIGNGSV